MTFRTIGLTALLIIFLALTAVDASAQTYVTVIVQPGDTLGKIANRYCTDWRTVYNINQQTIGPNPNQIEVGMALTVPNQCSYTPPPPPQTTTPPAQPPGVYDRGPRNQATGPINGPYYTVAWGDDLFAIASRFGVTAASIVQANGLSSTTLEVGQTLYIPGMGPPTVPATSTPQPTPPAAQRRQFAHGECTITLNSNAPTHFSPQEGAEGTLGAGQYMALEVANSGGATWYHLAISASLPGWIRSGEASYSTSGNCEL